MPPAPIGNTEQFLKSKSHFFPINPRNNSPPPPAIIISSANSSKKQILQHIINQLSQQQAEPLRTRQTWETIKLELQPVSRISQLWSNPANRKRKMHSFLMIMPPLFGIIWAVRRKSTSRMLMKKEKGRLGKIAQFILTLYLRRTQWNYPIKIYALTKAKSKSLKWNVYSSKKKPKI